MVQRRSGGGGLMVRARHVWGALAVAAALAGSSAGVGAQTTTLGAIEGTVKDETGGALPGVTVTVTSPALQVRELVAVTDADGRYRIPDLRIGTYRVASELQGFQGFVREGIEISVGFVARVDVTLKVGSLQETVTVSGASPVVDLTTTRGGQTISTQVVAKAIPLVGHQVDLVKLTPGLEGGLGGRAANPTQMGLTGNVSLSSYGQSGVTAMVEDFQMHSNNQPPMLGGTEQMDVKTYGNSAEIHNPGAAMNYVFSSGGNQFHGRFSSLFMDQAFQATNVDEALRRNGFTSAEALRKYYDLQGYLGGRILRDKLWFFVALRQRANERSLGGFVLNAGPDGRYLTGDEPPAYPAASQNGQVIKVSNQVSSKYQLGGFWWRDWTRDPGTATSGFFGNASPRTIPWEASTIYNLYDYVWNASVRGTPSNRVAFEVKGGRASYHTLYEPQPGSELLPTRYNRNTFLYTGSPISNGITTTADRYGTTYFHQFVGSMTYVPESFLGGDHQFKVGFRTLLTTAGGAVRAHRAGDYALVFDTLQGVPDQPVEMVTFSSPFDALNRLNIHSLYLSDQWRASERVTFNLGLRFERQNAFVPPQRQEAGSFVQAADYSKIPVGDWNLLAPRAAVAWDVTGNARTVVKGTYGWYNQELEYQATQFASLYNPVAATTTTYRWRDPNGNGDYDPGEVNLALTGNPDFLSISSAANTRPLSADFRVPHTHEFTGSLEHEIMPNMGGRFLYIYKRLVDTYIVGTPVNVGRPYDVFNIPLQRRDPGPDGTINTADDGPMVTVYDFDPAYRDARFVVNERINQPEDNVAQTIEGSLTKRLSNRWSLTGAFAATKQHRWLITAITNPNDEYFPIDQTWSHIVRLNGSYQLPFDISLGGTLAVKTGVLGQRTYVFRAADPLGGPPLRQQTNVTLRLEPYGASRGPEQKYFDLRLGKNVRVANSQLMFSLDVLNVLNTNIPEAINFTSGPTYGQVTLIPTPRILRFGLQFEF
ncbi:MAG: TonB-dependent receptor [Vicinamibacterales bacterium]